MNFIRTHQSGVKNSFFVLYIIFILLVQNATADSVNSPNITLNVDTNRGTGAGAGNVSVTISTITIAETMLPEYSSSGSKSISLKVRPGFQFDPTSIVTAQSATIGLNGGAVNGVAQITPSGEANEILTFSLTSGTSSTVQDIIRVNGIKLRIISAEGAAGPAQATLALTTSTAGGGFTNQRIVTATITRGAPDRLVFSIQPGSNQAGSDLLPEVKMVDFGGNLITADTRTITLSIQTNPASATLLGVVQHAATSGIAKWLDSDDLRIATAATGYRLRASHNGASFLTSDTVDSGLFNITSGIAGGLVVSAQPTDTAAGDDISVSVTAVDEFSNPVSGVDVTLDSAINPGGWPLLVDTSLTKTTSASGIASWGSADHLRINKAVTGYKLSASGIGSPVATNAFNIISGAPQLVRFIQQPSKVTENTVMAPPVTAEVIDRFGNRMTTSSTVDLTLSSSCKASVSGGNASTIDGVATFNSLNFNSPCEDIQLLGSVANLIGVASDLFDIKGADAAPIAIRSTLLRKGKVFKFSSNGSFAVPKKDKDLPTKNGGKLTVTGTTGVVKFTLPKSGWRKFGKDGFKFTGSKCQSVIVSKKSISAECNAKTGSFILPEAGPVDIVLGIGKGTASFCGQCGGTIKGDETKVFNRTSCDKPPLCP